MLRGHARVGVERPDWNWRKPVGVECRRGPSTRDLLGNLSLVGLFLPLNTPTYQIGQSRGLAPRYSHPGTFCPGGGCLLKRVLHFACDVFELGDDEYLRGTCGHFAWTIWLTVLDPRRRQVG